MREPDTFRDLEIVVFQDGGTWRYHLNGKEYGTAQFSKKIGVPVRALARLRRTFVKDQVAHVLAINDRLWKDHHGIDKYSTVTHPGQGGRVAIGGRPKVSFKPKEKAAPGYDPFDITTYRFLVDGEYYIGAREF